MTGGLHAALILGIFGLTLALVLIRPRGWNEAWWTMGGSAALLGLGLETPAQAENSLRAGESVLLFLLALLLLSALLGRSGFFDWAAVHAARLAGGDGRRLYRNTFLLGALTTATLSLDTTAVILTPLVLAFVARLCLPARPYVFACAFVANTASLVLPVSNLTNLLLAAQFHLPFGGFVAHMALPQGVALLVNYGLFRWLFRRELPAEFDLAALPEPNTLLPNILFFRVAMGTLAAVLVGYFIAPFAHWEAYWVGFAGCGVLLVVGAATRQVDFKVGREVAWSLFPFVMGLFVLVQGMETLGLAAHGAAWLSQSGGTSLSGIARTAGGAGLASNVVNNIPAALLSVGVLKTAHAPQAQVYAALLGTNLGPNLTLFGSLATMLVLSTARREGTDVRGLDFFRVGLLVMPATLLAASLALWAMVKVLP